jgi:aryl-alcohol dehydrogenase-like predicted oxidoreductase
MDEADFVPSRLGFGGAAIGLRDYMGAYDAGSDQAVASAVAAIQRAMALGVTYFDTAPAYGDGLSERIMGQALGDARERIFLATKVWPGTAGGARGSLVASLARLQRSTVDLLQIHGESYSREAVDAILAPGGLLEEMEALKREGLIRKIGFTVEDMNEGTYRLIETGRFDAVQLMYNLMLQHPYEPSRPFGALFEAKRHGMMTITMRTATSGIFQRWVQMVNPANRFDYTPALIQFVLSNRLVDVALVGMRTVAEVESCVDIWRDESGRIDIDGLWNRFIDGSAGWTHP